MRSSLQVALAIAFALTTGVSSAKAQRFGAQGDVSFAADRLMGFYIADDAGVDGLVLGLGVPPGLRTPYMVPRLGIDFFVIDGLSLGGTLGIWTADHDRDVDDDGYIIYPRIGYAIALSNAFGIWPRGGLTFWDRFGDEVALSGEVMFFATPGRQWGFQFGPTLDIGLAGDHAGDDEGFVLGLAAAGVFGWL